MGGNWYYSPEHGGLCRVIETQTLWGETVCRVWLPSKDAVVRLPAASLRPADEAPTATVDGIAYVATAARVADALTQDVLLAPIESSVIPLPHQIRALSRAVSGDRVRYLLADEVGLGKTIEAGLIMRELKLRGLVRRTLVIAPRGLVTQWVAEMRQHFNETFKLIQADDLKMLHMLSEWAGRDSSSATQLAAWNPWQLFDQVVCSMDSIKPLVHRQGWSKEQIAAYNQQRVEPLFSAGWDLIIVDEAHRLGGSTDQVARYKLGQKLANASPYLLLLSATPHQGKTDHFWRLMSLLDSDAFPTEQSISSERVWPYVIRTEKRQAIDAEGRPLFKPRRTELAPIAWKGRHNCQRQLYEAITKYVRDGYNKAILAQRNYVGFLMVLMQRLVASSTRAIRATLERRLEVLQEAVQGAEYLEAADMLEETALEELYDLDGETLRLLLVQAQELEIERQQVQSLLELAQWCESQGPDAKAEALLDWLYRLQAEEGDPDLKVLIFTEFIPTQEMLRDFLRERGFKVVCLNGTMNLEERQSVQQAFAQDARILISTDAGGEGINLQFCHVVVNYDIPWNPMRLEQRIGRVDRIGQKYPVRAINFVLKDSVEYLVLKVLEQKLAVILEELGIDKTSDVLDTAQAGRLFDQLFVEGILHPEALERKAEAVLKDFEEQARETRASVSLLGATTELDVREVRRVQSHPFPYWIERMTTSYLRAVGGEKHHVDKKPGAEPVRKEGAHTIWHLVWPDGREETVCFTHHVPHLKRLGFSEPRVQELVRHLPIFVPGQPIPVIMLPELSSEIKGFWSLWRISAMHEAEHRYRIMPLFLSDEGRLFGQTAQHVWDQLLVRDPVLLRYLDPERSQQAFMRIWKMAEQQGQPVYDELRRDYLSRPVRNLGQKGWLFAQRKDDATQRAAESEARFDMLPEMIPVLIARIEPK